MLVNKRLFISDGKARLKGDTVYPFVVREKGVAALFHQHHLMLLFSLLFVVCATFVAFPPPAHAATSSEAQEENCAVILAPVRAGESTSRELSTQCVPANQSVVKPAGYVLIMQLFSQDNWKGKQKAYFVKQACSKTVGYIVGKTSFKNTHSFYASNRCYHTKAYTKTNFGGQTYTWNYNPKHVGNPWRSNFNSFYSFY